jgi:hypothetical protein
MADKDAEGIEKKKTSLQIFFNREKKIENRK